MADLPDVKFHHLVISGLLSIYLSDQKVSRQKDVRAIAKKLLTLGGAETFFLYLHYWVYRRLP
jgi:tetraprenyl-beta-curcumene synthase